MTSDYNNDNIDDKLTSHWPLPSNGTRQITPKPLVKQLANHKLAQDLYPLGIGYYPVAKGHKMLRSEHTNYLLMYCSAGKGELSVGSNRREIAVGDLILLPPGVLHEYHADSEQPWSVYWLHIDGLLAKEYANTLKINDYCIHIGLQTSLVGAFDSVFQIRQNGVSLSNYLIICAQVKSLLLTAANLSTQPAVEKLTDNGLYQAVEYMKENVDMELNLDQLAGLCSLSKFHFVRKFKAFTGQTPIQYFIQLKIEQACRLLDNTQLPIKEISAQLGYPDSLYFSRLFKRELGVSPKYYRLLHSA